MATRSSEQDGDGDDTDGEFRLPAIEGIEFVNYVDEEQLDDVMRLVGQDLSEPYSVFTYRYFLHRWPQLCILAVPTTDDDGEVGDETEEGKEDRRRRPIGCVVCKIDVEDGEPSEEGGAKAETNGAEEADDRGGKRSQTDDKDSPNLCDDRTLTGYIGMLAVETTHRRSGIGTALVQRAIRRMQEMGCRSIRLETEVSNRAAMNLYEDRLGFVREELLKKYYLNWGDAYRLRLWLNA